MDLLNVQPEELYRSFVKEKTRPDGRQLLQTRPIVLNVGAINTANGSAMVKLGETMVVCGIKAELTVPSAQDPSKGIIVPNVDLPPLCSSIFKPGPPSEQAQVVTKFLDNILKSCHLINLEELCIVKDKLVWVLYCDLMCLNYDGNVVDASIMALFAALQNVRLPEITFNEETDSPTLNKDNLKSLHLNCCPSATTFTVFEGDDIIADPTRKEEEITEGGMTIVCNETNNIIYMERMGGVTLSDAAVQICIKKALQHGAEVRKLYEAVSGS